MFMLHRESIEKKYETTYYTVHRRLHKLLESLHLEDATIIHLKEVNLLPHLSCIAVYTRVCLECVVDPTNPFSGVQNGKLTFNKRRLKAEGVCSWEQFCLMYM
jgi:hypothetical protein